MAKIMTRTETEEITKCLDCFNCCFVDLSAISKGRFCGRLHPEKRVIENPKEIPDWCPLPDVKEDKDVR